MMAYQSFDKQYISIAKEILSNGVVIKGRNNLVYKQIFGQTIRVDLQMEFPCLTLRKMPVENLFREFLWDIKGQSEVEKLGKAKRFWDFLADENGFLPGAYGRSWRYWPIAHSTSDEYENKYFRNQEFDQLKWVYDQLQLNPTNRQLAIQTYNPSYDSLACPPCHPGLVFSSDGTYLDLLVTARSNDLAVGVPLDMFRYALLTKKMAEDSNLNPRFVQFTSANNHIYEVNEEQIIQMINRHPLNSGIIYINRDKSLFELEFEDFTQTDYVHHSSIVMSVAK